MNERCRGRPGTFELPVATSCSCVLFFVPSCVSKLPLKGLKTKRSTLSHAPGSSQLRKVRDYRSLSLPRASLREKGIASQYLSFCMPSSLCPQAVIGFQHTKKGNASHCLASLAESEGLIPYHLPVKHSMDYVYCD